MDNNEINLNACLEANNLGESNRIILSKLIDKFRSHLSNNKTKMRYYKDEVGVKNIGLAVPEEYENAIKTDVGWAAKAVDKLAERSMFDGYATMDNENFQTELDSIMKANDIKYTYDLALPSELIYGCGFWTVTAGDNYPIIRYYDAESACAIWDWDKRQILYGFVITDYVYIRANGTNEEEYRPSCIVLHTKDCLVTIKRISDEKWIADSQPHMYKRPLMEPMCFKPSDGNNIFGKSVISKTVRSIVDEMKRELLRNSLHSELYTSPAKYVCGITSPEDEETAKKNAEAIKAIMKMNEIFVAERDDDGNAPVVGQLNAASMQPHESAMQTLAKRMAAEADIPLNSLGIIHDNPSSAEALHASLEDLCVKAEALNRNNGKALINVAKLAIAIHSKKPFNELDQWTESISVCWKNPSQPSLSSVADAVMKQISVLPWMAQSDVTLEALNYNEAQRGRLIADRRKYEAQQRIAGTVAPIPVDNKQEAENGNTGQESA